jgi:hypothetical protein
MLEGWDILVVRVAGSYLTVPAEIACMDLIIDILAQSGHKYQMADKIFH